MIKSYLMLQGGTQDPFALRADAAAGALQQLSVGVRGYVQTRLLEQQINDNLPYCGFAELWLEESDALARFDVSQFEQVMLRPEVKVDAVVSGHERVVTRLPAISSTRCIKGVFPFRRAPHLSAAEFQRYWWRDHGPLAAETQDALSYVQLHPLAASYQGAPPKYDGVTEFYWPSADAAAQAMASEQMREVQAPDAQNFVATESVLLFLTGEEVVVAV